MRVGLSGECVAAILSGTDWLESPTSTQIGDTKMDTPYDHLQHESVSLQLHPPLSSEQ
jgi:hypothetical protein